MKHAFGLLAALLLVMVLASVVLAFTLLRPRTEVVSTSFEEAEVVGVTVRKRTQVTHHWSLSPLWKWSFGSHSDWGMHNPWRTDGWQYGPFVFVEKYEYSGWPKGMEQAALAVAVQKLGVKEPELDIQRTDSLNLRWHVVASAPAGKRLEMDYELTWDDHGKPLIRREQ